MMCCFQYPSFEPTPHPSGLPSPDPTALPSLPPTGAPTLVPTTFDTTRLYVSVVLKAEAAAETTEAIVLPAFKGLLGGANASIPNVIQNFVATFQGGATKGGNVMCTFSVVESYSELGYNGPGEFEVRPFLKKCLDTNATHLSCLFMCICTPSMLVSWWDGALCTLEHRPNCGRWSACGRHLGQ